MVNAHMSHFLLAKALTHSHSGQRHLFCGDVIFEVCVNDGSRSGSEGTTPSALKWPTQEEEEEEEDEEDEDEEKEEEEDGEEEERLWSSVTSLEGLLLWDCPPWEDP